MVTLDQAGRNTSRIALSAPAPALIRAVEHIWVAESPHVPDSRSTAWRIVPDTAPHLIWHVFWHHNRLTGRLSLVGARRIYSDIDASQRLLTVGARLRPGMIPVLFGVPAQHLTDRAVALADVVDTRSLEQRLWDGGSRHAADALEQYVHARFRDTRGDMPRLHVLASCLAGVATTPVTAAAATLGVSTRRVLALTQHHFGLSAKRFTRLTRLHRALSCALVERRPRWSLAASTAGYADQSHFVRECRALLGETPSAFLARRTSGE